MVKLEIRKLYVTYNLPWKEMVNREMDQAYTRINHEQTAVVVENQAAGPREAIGNQTERPAVCHSGRGIADGQGIGAVSSEDHAGQSCQGKEWQCALHHGVRRLAQLGQEFRSGG
ncbi:unnamed protein product [Clonostachys rosea f. rosea IK726]|uniref:Uncharacterized protein n=1 Tax=Clonostachys rosea f. rosea IK726 TaxID=1349383 RepID=A0ACA9T6B3_BIOOC|nr:unnamed protein product [Clonostachys rosea f. rosea IK726]